MDSLQTGIVKEGTHRKIVLMNSMYDVTKIKKYKE